MEYVNLNHLHHFYHVATHGSYSSAASALHIQQPALSKTVKALEDELGLQLFRRVGRGIELTREGEYVYSHCAEIFTHVDRIAHFAHDKDVSLKESVTIFCSDVIASKILPRVLGELELEYPGIRPIVSSGLALEMVNQMNDERGKIGLFFHTPKLPAGLKVQREIAVDYRLVIATRHYHSQKVRTSFIGSREVDDPSGMKFPTVEKMRKLWPQTQIRLSANSLNAHLEMVMAGLGVSILPHFLVATELERGTLKELLPEENFRFQLKVVTPTKIKLTTYEQDLINLVAAQMKQLN